MPMPLVKKKTMWFDSNWNLLEYVPQVHNPTNVNSMEVDDFDDCFEYVGLVDYKACRIHLKSIISEKMYTMFASDFNDVILNKLFVNNRIRGTFRYCKKNIAQSIKLIIK